MSMFGFSELKLRLDFTVLIGALLFVSCSGDEREPLSRDLPVRFSSGLSELAETRAANGSWDAGDQVGIYMVPHVAEASATADFSRYAGTASNVPYVTSGNGASVSLSVVSGHKAIIYPTDGSSVNFVAYYPYRADTHTTNGNVYKIDVSNQSSAKAIDLLYHKGTGTAYDCDDEDVSLVFTHQLSKLKISLVSASGVTTDLSGATLTLSGFPTTANFNLSTGVLNNLGGRYTYLTPVKDASASTSGQAVFEAIIVPHSGTSYTRNMTFRIGETNYSCAFPAASTFEAGIAYHYTFQFTGSKVVSEQKNIVDWEGGTAAWGNYRLTADKVHFDLSANPSSSHTVILSTNAPSAPTYTLSNDAGSNTGVPQWITGVSLSKPTTGENSWKTYTLTFGTDVNANHDAVSRTGYIRLEFAGLTLAIRITQAGMTLDVSDPIPFSFSNVNKYGSTSNSFTITTNAPDKEITVATTDPSVITNLTQSRSTVSADGYSTWIIHFNVSENTTTSARSATISTTIGGFTKTVPVSQLWGITSVHDGLTNCYMVTPGGNVSIPITRAITIGGLPGSAEAKVETLWDDNSVINGNPTLSGSGAERTITVRASSKDGNAVITLKDAAGTIYWSWHIWVLNDDPTKNTWTNNGFTFMDRNLGATENALSLAARGLFYQWGRKDPFPGCKAGTAGYAALSSFKGMSDAGTTADDKKVIQVSDNSSSEAGIMESIRNPTTFYGVVGTSGNWLIQIEKTLWNTLGGKKTIYDPCPDGWRIPIIGDENPWAGISNEYGVWAADNSGRYYDNQHYPACGYRAKDASSSGVIGTYLYNKQTQTGGGAWIFEKYNTYPPQPSGYKYNYYNGCSVRCAKDG